MSLPSSLNRSAEELLSILNSLDELVFEVDERGTILALFTRDRSQLLLDENAILGKRLPDLLGPVGAKALEKIDAAQRSGKVQQYVYSLPYTPPRWFSARIAPMSFTSQDGGARYSIVTRDVTQEKQTEFQLQEFKDRMSLALKSRQMGLWEYVPETGTVFWDEGMRVLFRTVGNQVDPKTAWQTLVEPEDQARISAEIKAIAQENRDLNTRFRVKDGEGGWRVLRTTGTVVHDEQGKVLRIVGFQWEITHQVRTAELKKQAEEELQSEKAARIEMARLVAIGEMSASLAHEINNPLSVLNGRLSLLRKSIENGNVEKEVLERHLESMEKTVQRASAIVRGLRTIARRGDSDVFERIQLGPWVDDVLSLCQQRFKFHEVELLTEELRRDLTVEGRQAQLAQVMLNLLNNAFDAIATRETRWISISTRVEGGFLELAVTDSGDGIPAPILEKLMTPGFTTKPVGQGTGLGLSISRGIMESHLGSLFYDKASAHTRFVMRWPLVHPQSRNQ